MRPGHAAAFGWGNRAPEARILAARAFSAQERIPAATTFSIIQSIDRGTRPRRTHHQHELHRTARSVDRTENDASAPAGVVLIAAAGNGGAKSRPLYPAAYAEVISVTATDADDKLFQGANRGTHITLATPRRGPAAAGTGRGLPSSNRHVLCCR
jgi:Subtilase family